jgi:allantoin racemase
MQKIGYCVAIGGLNEEEQERRRAVIKQWTPQDVEVELVVVSGGPAFLDQRSDFGAAVSATASFLAKVDPQRYGVLVSAGAIDPGLATFRAQTSIPVVGPGESAMFIGAVMAMPLSIVTVDEHAVAVSEELLDRLTVKPPIASVRSIEMPVRRIVSDLSGAREAVLRQARRAVSEDGAKVIYLGAMTLGTLGLDDEIRAELRVAVLNPIQVALATAVQCLRALPAADT